jgi:Fe-S cluster assembly protein SufD
VNEQTFPSTREEDWRFTDLSPMLAIDFAAVTESASVAADELSSVRLEESEGAQVVLVNGRFDAELSQLDALPEGAVVGSCKASMGITRPSWTNGWPSPAVAMKSSLP